MNLIRIAVIALIIYLLLQIFKRFLANKKAKTPTEEKEQVMVACKICKLHIPENEALQRDGQFYCSKEHLNKD